MIISGSIRVKDDSMIKDLIMCYFNSVIEELFLFYYYFLISMLVLICFLGCVLLRRIKLDSEFFILLNL